MQPCNILIGCDQNYYEQWAINLIKSIRHFNPFVQCHVHIVNPGNYQKIPNVEYTTEFIDFPIYLKVSKEEKDHENED